jgi:hypothetical protein
MPRNKTWKSAESRAGVWLGAVGIGLSGRQPLSGGNSGVSRSDTPHKTIFCEVKRDRVYQAAIRFWLKCEQEVLKLKCKDPVVLWLRKHTKNHNDGVILIHCDDLERIQSGVTTVEYTYERKVCKLLKLYDNTRIIWLTSKMDEMKRVCCCAVFMHNQRGFWLVLQHNDITALVHEIKQAREERKKILAEREKV